jgi:S-adenosylmethionine hydrolase
MASSRIITLTTDFGWDDHLVGAMKGAILSVNGEVSIVDITHSIPPHSILEGALTLKGAYRFFPTRTIHVGVVDPGVGSSRRGLVITSEKYMFVGPDNGIFSLVMDELEHFTCRELDAGHYYRSEVSPTFHGRDIFGPVAAWLTRDVDVRHMGEPVQDPVRISIPSPSRTKEELSGEIIHVDRFGNLITNMTRAELKAWVPTENVSCRFEGKTMERIPFIRYYGEVEKGRLCALVGSSGYIEIALNQANAASHFGVGRGHRITFIKG